MIAKTTTKKKSTISKNRGGRPTHEDARLIEDKILDTATAVFFKNGYGAVSIEEIVQQAHISKRTFYSRFENKEAVFRAVVHRIVAAMRPPSAATDQLFTGKTTEDVLRRIAPVILHASLTPSAIALHRIVLAEATRFPELALILNDQGARSEAVQRIAALLQADKKIKNRTINFEWAAEQFLQMITAIPQRRAMGLGVPMKAAELNDWTGHTIDIFLHGIRR